MDGPALTLHGNLEEYSCVYVSEHSVKLVERDLV